MLSNLIAILPLSIIFGAKNLKISVTMSLRESEFSFIILTVKIVIFYSIAVSLILQPLPLVNERILLYCSISFVLVILPIAPITTNVIKTLSAAI